MRSAIRRGLRPRIIVPAAVVTVVLLGAWTASGRLAASRKGEWTHVTRGEISAGVDVSGTLAAVMTEAFGVPQVKDMWDFKIAMMAPEGSDVKAGTPILAFEASELTKRLEEQSAARDEAAKQIEKVRADLSLRQRDEQLQYAEAEARLRKAALKLEAPPDIVGLAERKQAEIDHAVARREVAASGKRLGALRDAADAQIRLLESRHSIAAAAVSSAENAIQRMTVKAPRDGTVVYVTDMRGEKKKVGDSVWGNQQVVEIPDLRKMKANGEVDESDAGRIRSGQRVSVVLDAHPDDVFHGTIVSTGRTVQQKQGTRNPVKALRVNIALDRTDPAKMRPGMRFNGTVELQRVRNATLIPLSAVFVSDAGPVAYRRTLFGLEQVRLRLGVENKESVQVLSGLDPGDAVLLASKPAASEAKR